MHQNEPRLRVLVVESIPKVAPQFDWVKMNVLFWTTMGGVQQYGTWPALVAVHAPLPMSMDHAVSEFAA
jgi:hypothetical protein